MDCERMELQIGGWAEVGDLVGAHLVSPEQRVPLRESSASRLPSLPPLKIRPDAVVNSCYSFIGGMPGNVLLAFSIDGK